MTTTTTLTASIAGLTNERGRILLSRDPYDGAPRSWNELNLVIEEDGDVTVETRSRYGSSDGITMDRWHNRTLTYRLARSEHGATAIDAGLLTAWIEDQHPLIDRIVAGHSTEWNGSNYVGRLTEDARDASGDLEYAAYEADQSIRSKAGVYNVSAFFADHSLVEFGLAIDCTPEQIATVAARLTDEADRYDDVILVGDVAEFLGQRVAEEREEQDAA